MHFVELRRAFRGLVGRGLRKRMELLRGEANVSNPYRALQGLNRPGRRRDRRRKLRWRFVFLMLVGTASIVSTILSIVALMNTEEHTKNKLPAQEEHTVHRIAFGSSTAYDYSPQPVWSHGIIPSDPDAWIWYSSLSLPKFAPLFTSLSLCWGLNIRITSRRLISVQRVL